MALGIEMLSIMIETSTAEGSQEPSRKWQCHCIVGITSTSVTIWNGIKKHDNVSNSGMGGKASNNCSSFSTAVWTERAAQSGLPRSGKPWPEDPGPGTWDDPDCLYTQMGHDGTRGQASGLRHSGETQIYIEKTTVTISCCFWVVHGWGWKLLTKTLLALARESFAMAKHCFPATSIVLPRGS